MAWINTNIDIGGVSYLGHRQGIIFSVPFSSGLEVGDSFKADGDAFIAEAVTDLHGRGETLVIDSKEVKNDKSKARRVSVKSSGSDV